MVPWIQSQTKEEHSSFEYSADLSDQKELKFYFQEQSFYRPIWPKKNFCNLGIWCLLSITIFQIKHHL